MYTSSFDGMKDEGFWDVLRKKKLEEEKEEFYAEVGRKQEM